MLFDTGDGVPEDDTEAVRWYRRAAGAGNTSAQHNLGLMYANGEGVTLDFAQAYVWLSIAAGSGVEGIDRTPLDQVAAKLTAEARANAGRRATTCRDTAFKECGEP